MSQTHLSLGLLKAFFDPTSSGHPHQFLQSRINRAEADVIGQLPGLGDARRTSSQYPLPGCRISTRAQSYTRGPLAPSPALRRTQPGSSTLGASRSARRHPLSVSAHSTASTWGTSRRSSHSRRLRLVVTPKGTPFCAGRCGWSGMPLSQAPQPLASVPKPTPAVEFPVQGPPLGRGVGDLAVLDPPRRAAILPLHPNGLVPLLQKSRLVHHQNSMDVAQMLHHVVPEIVANQVGVPDVGGQQVGVPRLLR